MTISGQWLEQRVAGHPCRIFEPNEPHPSGFVLLYLHGVHEGSLRDSDVFTRQFDQHGLRVIEPRAKRCWWLPRICGEFDQTLTPQDFVIKHVVDYIGQRWNIAPPKIGLFGTSMGGQGALRLSYFFPDVFPTVAAISPAIDFHKRLEDPEEDDPLLEMYEDPESARQDTAILHIHPLNWPRHQFFCCDPTDQRWWDGADRLRMKLYSLGIPFDCDLETEAGGHGFTYYNHMASRVVSFLINSLDSEQLRVV